MTQGDFCTAKRPTFFRTVSVGMAFGALAFAVVGIVASPEFRTPTGIAGGLLVGAALGLFIWGACTIVSAVACRYRVGINRYSRPVNAYTSMAMLFAGGYCIACANHGVSDKWPLIAGWVAGLGAIIKVALAEAAYTDSA